MEIRSAQADDIDKIVAIHLRAFPGFFLSSLGQAFLRELYLAFLSDAAGRLFVAEEHGKIAGFAAGTLAPESFFRALLLRRWYAFAWAALGVVIRRPQTVIPRLLSGLVYRGERPTKLPRAALLSSIAVDPQISGSGIGSALVSAFCEEASRNDLGYVYLTTDQDGNDVVNRFYLRRGFNVESKIHRHDGRIMIRYVRCIGIACGK